jgi:uncharacterized membrane protein YeaQ/YmgE (transglycosylase-associated protein family)
MLNIIGWLVLGAIAGYIAGLLVKGDESLGVIGHIVLGIVGAVVGGVLYGLLLGGGQIIPSNNLDAVSIIVAVIGAVIVVVAAGWLSGSRRVGQGPI